MSKNVAHYSENEELVRIMRSEAQYSYVEPKTGERFPTTEEDVDNYRRAHYEVSRRFVSGWEKI